MVLFHYDSSERLISISGPGLNGGRRVLLRLGYGRLELRHNFAPPLRIAEGAPDELAIITALYRPGTNTGYWFDDPDSYSSYGILRKVAEHCSMGFTGASPDDPGRLRAAQWRVRSYTIIRSKCDNSPLRRANICVADRDMGRDEHATRGYHIRGQLHGKPSPRRDYGSGRCATCPSCTTRRASRSTG